jgi:molybdate transport system ATP-binding protein
VDGAGDLPAAAVRGRGLTAHLVVDRGGFRLDVRVAVTAGEVLAVLGPNGAGKTTLLRALAGLTPLTEGELRLDGELLDHPEGRVFVPPEQRPVGVVFQDYRLFPHLSVRENVAFGLRAQGAPRGDARATADGWLSRVGLADLAGRRPAQLSGGQAQRVALARALASRPGLLLLDEPLAALDADTRHAVRAELEAHLREFAGPALLVTHDPLEAMLLADRLLVLEHGTITQQGTPATVARRPATPYVATLLGVNLYAGRLTVHDAEHAAVVMLQGGGALTAVLDEPAAPGAELLLALRPSALTVHTEHPHHLSTRNIWPATVTGLELLHDRVRLQATGAPSALVDVTPTAVAELDLRPGSQIWLAVKATDITAYPR